MTNGRRVGSGPWQGAGWVVEAWRGGCVVGLGTRGKPFREHMLIPEVFIEPLLCAGWCFCLTVSLTVLVLPLKGER